MQLEALTRTMFLIFLIPHPKSAAPGNRATVSAEPGTTLFYSAMLKGSMLTCKVSRYCLLALHGSLAPADHNIYIK